MLKISRIYILFILNEYIHILYIFIIYFGLLVQPFFIKREFISHTWTEIQEKLRFIRNALVCPAKVTLSHGFALLMSVLGMLMPAGKAGCTSC